MTTNLEKLINIVKNKNIENSKDILDVSVAERKEDIKDGSKKILEITSSGFHSGNFCEFKLNNEIILNKFNSKRGFNVVFLSDSNYYFNFDFYIKNRCYLNNKNLLLLFQQIPVNTIFGIGIKDDGSRNLFMGSKKFINLVLGSKQIYNLAYRESWAAIVYKRSKNEFVMLSESLSKNDIAVATYDISNLENVTHLENISTTNTRDIPKDKTLYEKIDNMTSEIDDIKKMMTNQLTLIKQLSNPEPKVNTT